MEGAGVTTTTGASNGPGSVGMTPEGATVLSLPEGSSMMIGEDGEQYVTIQQDGQTYAIPLSEYQSMQPGGTITIQAQQISDDLVNNPPQVVVQQATPTTQVRVSEQPKLPTIAVSPQKTSSIKWQSPKLETAAHRPWVGSTLEPRKFKPIKVDNWGIFLLSRLQAYFQKKEYTDLTLRFPSKNAQIKVHKLVVNACTDYFIKAQDLGLIQDGVYDMPGTLLPEYVAPIIRFMYTGRLDLKSHMFEKMKATSTTLGMSVLTKLLDAQLNAPPEVLANAQQKKQRKIDPVRQIKQIKKIEKKFEREQRRSILERQTLPSVFVVPNTSTTSPTTPSIVPGKKLPIWKKRETQVNTQQNELDIKHEISPKSYGKKIENGRQLREIQENANFEKLRTDNSDKDMSVDEIKEFMDDQRDEDEDDYYDNDAGLDYDEALEEDDVEHEHHQIEIPKPILKSAEKADAPPRKSVRFSLRPGSVPKPVEQPEMITPDTPEETVSEGTIEESIAVEKPTIAKSPPKKRKSNEDAMDKTVDEFSKVIEQEESETRTRRKTRKGRVVNPPNLDMPSTPKSSTAKKSPSLSTNQDHTAMIAELMKKNPELFKGNKPVKIRVMSKDASGKNSVKVITVKAQPQIGAHVEVCTTKNIDLLTPKNITPSSTPSSSTKTPTESQSKKSSTAENEFGLRTTPKVKYTGKRGRPPIIKPGESDPHAKERKEIASKMQNNYAKIVIQTSSTSTEKAMESDTYTTFEQVSPDKLVTEVIGEPTGASTSQLDPSSEAEALSHVASGIAASLGITEPADSPSNTTTEPIEHLEELDFREENVVKINPAKRGRPSPNSSLEVSPPKKVSKLALEWDEEEERNT